MANPIFDNQQQGSGNGNIFDFIRAIKDPKAEFEARYNSNPQFRDFANAMRNKSPKEAFEENGKGQIYEAIKHML